MTHPATDPHRAAHPVATGPTTDPHRGGGAGGRRVRTVVGLLTAVSLVLAGCGVDSTRPADDGDLTGPVTVFAAASLTEPFTTLGRRYEAEHPGSTVTFNFAGSSALATQITQGAPADVFASAAPRNMATVTDAGHAAGTPTVFARNQLVIAVPQGNPQRLAGLADLTRPGLKVALCAAQVPCGAAATTALDRAGVRVTPVTLEQDVKGTLAKVKLGEVDAALVYRTDARSADREIDGIEFPESAQAVNDYPIVVLADAPHPTAARAFVELVHSAAGRTVLTDAGFQPPAGP
ncbi:molybdate ABC transporter substrate-binding protein [Micromonospora antibiotica]|uniref:Molybdate ABC transporter substrate-binding protein n=1 Tax=Micromonospora antibiotica TaxID=2807623 RepID=A0ABS3VHN7_9ACTN|nr:molybdate ABC transporter substrate-binding protein [Micromonospora antibiotica]MBO4165123.1 molybdate ABC transporter substrate-binding protein [Micromonospora antibiotica]